MTIDRNRASRAHPLFRKSVYALAVAAAFGAPPVLASFSPGDPLTSEIQVNTTTFDHQEPAGVAMDAAGDFVVTWTSFGQDAPGSYGSNRGTYARVIRADGTSTSEIAVNTTTVDIQAPGGVAMDAAGDFVVTWSGASQDGSGIGVYARVFNADGTPATGEIQVNTTTIGDQIAGGVAIDSTGNFVVTWRSMGQDGSGYGAYARVFAANGTPTTAEIPVNTTTDFDQIPAGVAMNASGAFVVTWSSNLQDGDGKGVYARTFSAGGVPGTGEIQVNTTTSGDQSVAGVGTDAAGDFVVAWSSPQDGYGSGAYARAFHASGTPITAEIQVNTSTDLNQFAAGTAMDAKGNFAVTWNTTTDGSGYGSYARVFQADGTPASAEVQVNTTTLDTQTAAGLAMDSAGDFAVTWASYGQDGSKFGAYARKFVGIHLPVDLSLTQSVSASPVQINTSGGLTYSLTAHNNSTTDGATSLTLTETLASGLSYSNIFSSADPWNCSALGQVVSCSLPSLAFATASSVDLTVDTGGTAGPIKTVGNVSAVNPDPVAANNNKNITSLLCDPAAQDSIAFGSASYAASEGVPVTITVQRTGTSCSNATVHYSTTSAGSAPAGDFTATSGDFTWLPLDGNKKTFAVAISNDSIYSGNRTVTLALSSPGNATLAKPGSVITIRDDDSAPTIGLSSGNQSVSEEGGVATVTALLKNVRSIDTVVPLFFTGTAIKNTDYSLPPPYITIPAGLLSASLTLTGLSDALDEADETVTVTMGTVSGVAPAGTTSNVITFLDDDPPPAVAFEASAVTKREDKGDALSLVLSTVSAKDVIVRFSISGGSATKKSDYKLVNKGVITIPAGDTSATAVMIIDDHAVEGTETATFQIDSATNATPSGVTSATLTILDNDP